MVAALESGLALYRLRAFVAAIVAGIAVLGCVLPTVAFGQGTPTQDETVEQCFPLYDALRLIGKPDLSSQGLEKITISPEAELWPKGASRDEPDKSYIRTHYLSRLDRRDLKIIVIDIEVWKLYGVSPSRRVENIERYLSVIDLFKRSLPGVKIGYYSTVPAREYAAIIQKDESRLANWKQVNEELRPIADASDVIFPSLYTFEDDADKWLAFANANLAEANSYGKPVMPFLWPYLYSKQGGHRAEVSRELWRLQLETVQRAADGAVLWSARSDHQRWDKSYSWWVETQEFIREQSGCD